MRLAASRLRDTALLESAPAKLSTERIHAVLLEILRTVMAACDRHGVEVCMIGGGCLGLVRHGGFVPWDDDLDLAIRVADFPAFLRAMDDLPGHLQVHERPKRHNPTYQVVDMRTRITGGEETNGAGLFVDIVPMMRWRSNATKRLDNIVTRVTGMTTAPARSRSRTVLKRVLMRLGVPGIVGWLGEKVLYPAFLRHDLACDAASTGIVSGAYGCQWVGRFDHDVVYPLRRTSFCGVEVSVPNDLHAFLVARYGEGYMVPPDEKSRWKHFESASEVGLP